MISNLPDPTDVTDSIIATLVAALLLLSAAAAAVVLLFLLRASRSPRRRRHLRFLGLNSLWPVRLLLVLFSALWSLAEVLRLRHLHCRSALLASHAFAEPGFFATLLFLLHASTQPPKPASTAPSVAFAAALAAAVLAALPFLLLHALLLYLPASAIIAVGLRPGAFAEEAYVDAAAQRCTCPLFATVLLAGFGTVYVPLFVSACWGAVAVVINKRLRIRLYVLAAAVVVALSVQVAALALYELWSPGGAARQVLFLAAFLAVLLATVAGEGILVIQPVVDALAIVEPQAKDGGAATAGGGDCVDVEEG